MAAYAKTRWIFTSAPLFLMLALGTAQGANVATVGVDEGYSGRVLDKIVRKWDPPQQLKREHRLKAVLSLDGEGNLLNCRVASPSGLQALDVSACAAAKAASPFGAPPYGMPAEVYFTFWTGGPSQQIPPEPDLQADQRGAKIAVENAREANDRARAMAEAAAKKTGKPLPGAKDGKKDAAHQEAAARKPNASKPEAPQTRSGKQPMTALIVESRPRDEPAKSGPLRLPGEDDSPKAQHNYDERYQKYLTGVIWKLRNAMFVPAEAKPGVYHVTVELKCDKAGRILSAHVLDGSGSEVVDRYALQGIKRAGSIPPPPPELDNTLQLTFTLKREKRTAKKPGKAPQAANVAPQQGQ